MIGTLWIGAVNSIAAGMALGAALTAFLLDLAARSVRRNTMKGRD